MTSKNNELSNGNSDDWLKNAIDDAVAPYADEAKRKFSSIDHNDKYLSQLNSKKEEVLEWLATEMPSAQRLIASIEKNKEDNVINPFDSLARLISEKRQEAGDPDDASEPRMADLSHLQEITDTVADIALTSLYDPDMPINYPSTKAGIQAAVAESNNLAPEDKQALNDAAEHFLIGKSYDPADPLQVVEAIAELNKDQAEAAQDLYDKAGRVTDSMLGYPFGIDVTSEEYFNFKKAIQEATTSDNPDLVAEIEKYNDIFGLPPEEFTEAVENVIRLARDPDWDDDWDWTDDEN